MGAPKFCAHGGQCPPLIRLDRDLDLDLEALEAEAARGERRIEVSGEEILEHGGGRGGSGIGIGPRARH